MSESEAGAPEPCRWTGGGSPTADARQLLDQLRADLQPLGERVVRHPYLHALEAGKVPRTAPAGPTGASFQSGPGWGCRDAGPQRGQQPPEFLLQFREGLPCPG